MNLDDYIKERIENTGPEPSGKVWSNIQSKLDANHITPKKNELSILKFITTNKLIIVFITLLISTATYFLFTRSNHQKKIKSNEQIVKPHESLHTNNKNVSGKKSKSNIISQKKEISIKNKHALDKSKEYSANTVPSNKINYGVVNTTSDQISQFHNLSEAEIKSKKILLNSIKSKKGNNKTLTNSDFGITEKLKELPETVNQFHKHVKTSTVSESDLLVGKQNFYTNSIVANSAITEKLTYNDLSKPINFDKKNEIFSSSKKTSLSLVSMEKKHLKFQNYSTINNIISVKENIKNTNISKGRKIKVSLNIRNISNRFSFKNLTQIESKRNENLNKNSIKATSINCSANIAINLSKKTWIAFGAEYGKISLISKMNYELYNVDEYNEEATYKLITPLGFFTLNNNNISSFEDEAYRISLKYIKIPIEIQQYVTYGSNLISFKAGYQLNYLVSDRAEIKSLESSFITNKYRVLGVNRLFHSIRICTSIERHITSKILIGGYFTAERSISPTTREIFKEVKTSYHNVGLGVSLNYLFK